MAATVFPVALLTWLIAHNVADHWIQTDHQATTKDKRTLAGQWSCAKHVLTLTATLAATLAIVGWRLDLDLDPARVAVALAVNAVSHYWADRRTGLLRLARLLGKGGWIDADPKAAYLLDQSWHMGWLLIAALIAV